MLSPPVILCDLACKGDSFCVFCKTYPLNSRFTSHTDDAPDIKRSAQSEDKRGEQDGGSRELELPVLTIVHVCKADLREEEYGEHKIDYWKHDVVYDLFDLPPYYLIYLPRYQSSYADPEMVIALAFLLPEIIPAGVQKSDAVTETM